MTHGLGLVSCGCAGSDSLRSPHKTPDTHKNTHTDVTPTYTHVVYLVYLAWFQLVTPLTNWPSAGVRLCCIRHSITTVTVTATAASFAGALKHLDGVFPPLWGLLKCHKCNVFWFRKGFSANLFAFSRKIVVYVCDKIYECWFSTSRLVAIVIVIVRTKT